MNMFSLSGKTAIITGGNSGIGLGMAKGLAEAGANVVIIGRNKIKNEDSIKILTQYNVKSISIEADVRNAAEISKALKIIKETFKEINILINNAGTTIRSQP